MSGKERIFAELTRLGNMICPVCGKKTGRLGDSLVCAKGHTLNVNRKGYLNLLSRKMDSFYDELLFDARERVYASGMYRPVLDAVRSGIPAGEKRILDAGCGEGWCLASLLENSDELMGAGVDLSVPAIVRAARRAHGGFLVCDLKRLPFAPGSFDVVLDILTPADYAAFERVLKNEGMLIKVFPGREYLREIREARGMPLYEEGAVENWLGQHLADVRMERVHAVQTVSPEIWRDLVYMTPLNQALSPEEKEELAGRPRPQVTLDLNVAFCRYA